MQDALSSDVKLSLFNKMMSKDSSGDEFVEALQLADLDILKVIKYVSEYQPTKGRQTTPGGGKSGKIMKGFAKAAALKYPGATSKEALFASLIDFLQQDAIQDAIYVEFSVLAQHVDPTTGMVKFRAELSPLDRQKLQDRLSKARDAKATPVPVPAPVEAPKAPAKRKAK
jgi:hypothetical protein